MTSLPIDETIMRIAAPLLLFFSGQVIPCLSSIRLCGSDGGYGKFRLGGRDISIGGNFCFIAVVNFRFVFGARGFIQPALNCTNAVGAILGYKLFPVRITHERTLSVIEPISNLGQYYKVIRNVTESRFAHWKEFFVRQRSDMLDDFSR